MRRSIHVVALAGVLAVLLATLGAGAAFAVTPVTTITSSGPLEAIHLGDELSCQVDHTADTALQFFPSVSTPGDCGTFVETGGALYAPDFANHNGSATGGLGIRTPFTPAGQTAVTGTGTSADPFRVVTTVGLGQTGLTIEQTDSYVVGDEAYRTDVEITNGGSAAQSGVLYRAGDCFLGGSDFGFGFTETFGGGARKAVGCSVNANNTPPGRILEWVPLTGGNNFYQAFFGEVWSAIGAGTAFPDTCECTQNQDNGAGISWSFSLPAAGSATFSHVTTFSPTGLEALETTKTADAASSTAGTQNGYTITISNPNPVAVTLDSIQDTLPAGFSYVANTTSGATGNNPTINGQTLTWTGPPPIVVPANGTAQLHFNVLVSNTPGQYFNQAGGDAAGGFTVLGTGPTAPITVTAPSADLSVTKTDTPDPVQVGTEVTYTITVANAGPDPAADVVLTDTLPPNITFGSATASQGTGCTHAAGTVTCNLGTVTTATPATVTIKVTPTTDVDLSNTASVDATTADPVGTNDSDTETTQVDPRPLSADLSLVKTDSPDPVTVGQPLTYTILVTNGGPDPAAGVTVTDTLPAGVTFGSAAASQGTGCTHAAGTVTCNLGTVTTATPATVTITVTPTGTGVLSNTASVSSTTADPVSGNNTDTETTQANAPAGPTCNGLPATFVGGPGNTYFQGGPGTDVVVDMGGNNYLQTGGGNDHICLGGGDDEVDSGDGNDFVDAGGGKNKVKTGNGNDVVLSGAGDDELDTGNGVDMVTDTGGKNKIYTGNEADQVTAGSGHDEIDTGDGDDVVAAGDGNNEVKAGNGNDQITAGAGDDKVDGGNGVDSCNAGGGRNEVKDCEGVAGG